MQFIDEDHRKDNFARQQLTDYQFQNCNLQGVSFQNATLTRVSFYNCNIKGCDFTNASLVDVSFANSMAGDSLLGLIDIGMKSSLFAILSIINGSSPVVTENPRTNDVIYATLWFFGWVMASAAVSYSIYLEYLYSGWEIKNR